MSSSLFSIFPALFQFEASLSPFKSDFIHAQESLIIWRYFTYFSMSQLTGREGEIQDRREIWHFLFPGLMVMMVACLQDGCPQRLASLWLIQFPHWETQTISASSLNLSFSKLKTKMRQKWCSGTFDANSKEALYLLHGPPGALWECGGAMSEAQLQEATMLERSLRGTSMTAHFEISLPGLLIRAPHVGFLSWCFQISPNASWIRLSDLSQHPMEKTCSRKPRLSSWLANLWDIIKWWLF